MDGYEQRGSLWVPEGTPLRDTNTKSWQDVLYAVRDNRLEEWSIDTLDAYKDNSTIYRGINLLATNVAQVPLGVYRGEEPTQPNHEIHQLFIKPSGDVCRFELWEKTTIYLYTYGEVMWYLNINDGGYIKEIYVLHPKYMRHEKDKQTGQIKSWVFNNKIPMAKEQVIHFKLPSTKGLRGMSPLQTVIMEYGADYHAAKYNQKFFENFAQPGGYLKTDKDAQISVEEMRRVVSEWNKNHRGSNNVSKIGGLLGGMEYKEVGLSQKDMNYIEGRDAIRDRIIIALGLNKTAMGISDDVNLANAREGMRQVWTLTLKPQLIRIEEKLNAEFFIPFFPGYHCKFDLSGVEELKKDFNNTLKAAKELLHMGYTRNVINERLSLDMPDSEDNEDLIPFNLLPRGKESEPVKEEPKKELTIDKVLDMVVDKQQRYRQVFLRVQQGLERQFHSKMKKYLFEQRKDVLKIVNEAKHSHNITNNLNSFFNDEDPRLKKLTKPLYYQAAEAGIELAKTTLGKEIKTIVDDTAILDRLNTIIGINHTVYNQIRMELYEGLQAGETINQITKRIRGIYNFAEKRARTIARTETGGLMNHTAFNEYAKEGVQKKQWVGGTRPTHAAQNGTTIGIGEIFPNGCKFPGDSAGGAAEVINCRCALAPVVE